MKEEDDSLDCSEGYSDEECMETGSETINFPSLNETQKNPNNAMKNSGRLIIQEIPLQGE